MILLKGNDFAEAVEAKQCRLSSVPGESNHGIRAGINVLENIHFQQIV